MTTVFTLKSSNKKYIEIILELENGIISCQNKLPKENALLFINKYIPTGYIRLCRKKLFHI